MIPKMKWKGEAPTLPQEEVGQKSGLEEASSYSLASYFVLFSIPIFMVSTTGIKLVSWLL